MIMNDVSEMLVVKGLGTLILNGIKQSILDTKITNPIAGSEIQCKEFSKVIQIHYCCFVSCK